MADTLVKKRNTGRNPNPEARMPTDKELEALAKRAAKEVERGDGRTLRRAPQEIDIPESENETKVQVIQRHIMRALEWYGKPLVKSDEECEERLIEYFETCLSRGELPTMEGMALCMGTTRTTVNSWESGTQGQNRSVIIKKAKELIAQIDAGLVNENKLPVVAYIFRSKNYYGLSDKQEMVLTPNTGMDAQSPQELERRYLSAIPEED